MNADVIIINISQLVTLANNSKPRYGKEMEESAIITDAGIAIKGGNIIEINDSKAIGNKYLTSEIIDAEGKIATPGFVDCHTHPVFVHTREDEFAMRLQGKSYVEIA
ncbi:MAG: imidazolonepropionase, partial [Candidatus Cloacimonas sp.]|nr:imidazolonepropionase [Candidatus Cloacimonas sp.]